MLFRRRMFLNPPGPATACVELFGRIETRGETVVQSCGPGQIDAPEVHFAQPSGGGVWTCFQSLNIETNGGAMQPCCHHNQSLGYFSCHAHGHRVKCWETYNFQVFSSTIVLMIFPIMGTIGNISGLTSSFSGGNFHCSSFFC